jgi:hypothetical protein
MSTMSTMSTSNALRSDVSATYFTEMCTAAGQADTTFTHLKYLSVREVKAMPVDELRWEFTRRTQDCMTYRVRGWAEVTPRGVRKFYVRSEQV